ncbi:hypothetical protein M406DRAFT_358259 [Cryphonectria parasitica EP155]|uniref:Uncharacterized protein n=1 Tax=Cryphonectria parasitica (strain ATCC 38755 / EP155) TaxID=660469 RepID=A0A9P5CIB5_CRYP1|nr:uncharacterized protein M406DRAFT_358259 [Cryphonectria parasitica EP155]KAF3760624.1 hypothetical protein M406DRAFT_358259 [Cryphonectria parasitica EP155]
MTPDIICTIVFGIVASILAVIGILQSQSAKRKKNRAKSGSTSDMVWTTTAPGGACPSTADPDVPTAWSKRQPYQSYLTEPTK